MFELEGVINSRTCSVDFLNRSLPIFPVAHHKIKPGKTAYIKVRIPFVEKLSGITNVKLMYKYNIGYHESKNLSHSVYFANNK